jgi:hypothetical protein
MGIRTVEQQNERGSQYASGNRYKQKQKPVAETRTPSPLDKRTDRGHIYGDVEVSLKTQCCSSCGRR